MGLAKPVSKRRKRKEKTPIEPASTVGEATKQLLQAKKISKKFNYEVLDSLLEGQSVKSVADTIQKAVDDK